MLGYLKHSKLIVIIISVVTLIMALQLPRLKLENDARDCFMPHEDESYKRMLQSEDDFAGCYVIGVALETTERSVLTPEILGIVKNIYDRLETVDDIDIVDSVANIDYICVKDGGLVATPLIDDDLFVTDEATGKQKFIGDTKAIEEIESKIVGWQEMYDRVILSDDGRATQLQIVLRHKKMLDDGVEYSLGGNDRMAALGEIRKIVNSEIEGHDVKMSLYGDTVMSDNSRTFMLHDLVRLIPIVVIVVIGTLFFSFKTLDGTMLPLLTVLVSAIWSCGLMAIFGVPFTIVSSIIPVALIAVGSAYGIHVLTHYYIMLDAKLDSGVSMTRDIHGEVITAGLKDVFVAVLLAGLTTIVGFASLITSPLVALRSFAVFTSLGVFFSLFLSLTYIPCLLMLKPISKIGLRSAKMERIIAKAKAKAEKKLEVMRLKKGEHRASGGTLFAIYRFFAGTAPRLIVFGLCIVSLSIAGVKRLVIETSMINYFPKTSTIRRDVDYVNSNFAGSNTISLIVTKLSEDGDNNTDITDTTSITKNTQQNINENTNEATQSQVTADDFSFEELGGEFSTGAKDVDTNNTSTDSNAGSVTNNDNNVTADDFSFDFGELTDGGLGGDSGEQISTQQSGETGIDNGCADVEMLLALDNLQDYLCDRYSEIGKVVSFTTFVKRMNSVMNDPYIIEPTEEEKNSSMIDVVEKDGTEYINSSQYRRALEMLITANDFIKVLNAAYVEAGGKRAKVEDIIRIAEKKLNYNGLGFYEIPYNVTKYPVASRAELSNLVSQYLMLLGGDTLRRFSSPSGSFTPKKIRAQLQLRTHSTVLASKILRDAQKYVTYHFPKGYKVEFTGGGQIDCVMTDMIMPSQTKSLLFSLISVFIIISISFKDPRAGVLGVIPLGLTILLNYMVMGFAHIRLDLVTSIIASVAIGVGIDYTIHFLETFRNERRACTKMSLVLKNTFNKSGVGIVTNAMAVGLGFIVLCGSEFVVLQCIGVLVAIVMFTSATLAMTIIPGVLNLSDPNFMKSKEEINGANNLTNGLTNLTDNGVKEGD